jgi:Arf-GAP/coiled-coil/ANK repeat/PH domain-containing protein
VDFLLQWSSNVNQPDDDGYTSLHHAALSSNVRLVLSLLKRHAKSDVKDNDGKVNPLLCTPRKSNLLLR